MLKQAFLLLINKHVHLLRLDARYTQSAGCCMYSDVLDLLDRHVTYAGDDVLCIVLETSNIN